MAKDWELDVEIDEFITRHGWIVSPAKKMDIRYQYKEVAKAGQKKLVEYLFRERRGVQPLRILHLDPLEWQDLLENLGVK